MKQLLVVVTLLASVVCLAQRNIPVIVRDAFKKDFPKVIVKKWEKEDGNYEASFTKDNKTMSALYSAGGTWIETETDIDIKQLPAAVITYIHQYYKNAVIKEAALLQTPNGKRYEAEVKGVNKDLLFDGKGKFLNEEKD